MKSFIYALLPAIVLGSPADLFARDCSHDNCLRAVIASAYSTRSVSQDCSAFLKTTVTPATSTATTYITLSFSPTVTIDQTATTTVATTTDVVFQEVVKRQVTVATGSIPTYASACSGSIKYSSACSCISVLPTTITAATPVTTSTIYVSVTSTTISLTTTVSTALATATATEVVTQPFALRIQGPDQFTGQYLKRTVASTGVDNRPYYQFLFVQDLADADTFDLASQGGSLFSAAAGSTDMTASSHNPEDYYVYLASAAEDVAGPATSLSCTVASDLTLQCSQPDSYGMANNVVDFGRCGGLLGIFGPGEISAAEQPQACGFVNLFSLLVVPVGS